MRFWYIAHMRKVLSTCMLDATCLAWSIIYTYYLRTPKVKALTRLRVYAGTSDLWLMKYEISAKNLMSRPISWQHCHLLITNNTTWIQHFSCSYSSTYTYFPAHETLVHIKYMHKVHWTCINSYLVGSDAIIISPVFFVCANSKAAKALA